LLKRHATTIYKFILKLKEYICYKVKQHESIKQFLLVCKRTTPLLFNNHVPHPQGMKNYLFNLYQL
jgi:hypothetical protein